MKLEHLEREAPGFFKLSGGYTMIVKPYTDQTSNGLTKCIEDFVTFSGGYANRISTTGMMRRINREMRWTKGSSNKGAADIRILLAGKSADVEVKIGADTMSSHQHKEQQRIEKAGGLYFVARDMPAFIDWFNKSFSNINILNNEQRQF